MRALLIVCLLAGAVRADPPDVLAPKRKSPAVARAYAVGVTAMGIGSMYLSLHDNKAVMNGGEAVLFWGGLWTTMFGPSAGHIYVGKSEGKHVSMQFGIRCVAFTIALGGFFKHGSNEPDTIREGRDQMRIGAGIFVASALYDLFDAGRAVERYNDRQNPKPIPFPTLVGGAPGIGIAGAF